MNASTVPTTASQQPLADHPFPTIRSSIPAVLTIPETAMVLTISKRKAADLIASGKLKALRLGRRRVVTRAALAAFTNQPLS